MEDRAIVALLRDQDPAGLARAYDAYGKRLYGFCRALLRDGSTAEDVVQDTLLIAYQRAGQLRDPERFRPWLYALARNECLRHIRSRRRVATLDEAGEVAAELPDPGIRLHKLDLSRLVWHAAEGLNARERAALELSVRHGLAGQELADALGVTVNHAQTLLMRARQQLERGLSALLVSGNGPECPELGDIVAGWDGRLTVLMRKRISRHVERCGRCTARKQEEVNATALLAAVPLPLPPPDLRARLVRRATDPADIPVRESLAARVGRLDPDEFPGQLATGRRSKVTMTAVAVVILALLLGGVGLMSRPVPDRRPVAGPGDIRSDPTVTSASPTSGSGASEPESGPVPSRQTPETSQPVTPTGTPTRTSVPEPSRVPSASRPVVGDLGFGVNPLDLGVLSEKDVTVRAVGGPVTWTAVPDARLSVTPSMLSLTAGEAATVTVRLVDSGGEAGSADVPFRLDDGSREVLRVTWDKPIG